MTKMEKKNNFYVYAHFEKDTGRLFYIGKGSNKRAWDFWNRNRHWKSIVKKHGVEAVIVSKNLTEEEAFIFEAAIIMDFDIGILATYTNGGPGISGYRHTDQSKERMSLAKIGKPMSESTKTNMSISIRSNEQEMSRRRDGFLMDKNPSRTEKNRQIIKNRMINNNPMKDILTRQKMAKSLTGRKISQNTIEKVRLKLKGRKNGPMSEDTKEKIRANQKKRRVVTSCGLSFDSTIEAARFTGARQGNIVNNCSGRTKSAGGYKWEYKNELA